MNSVTSASAASSVAPSSSAPAEISPEMTKLLQLVQGVQDQTSQRVDKLAAAGGATNPADMIELQGWMTKLGVSVEEAAEVVANMGENLKALTSKMP